MTVTADNPASGGPMPLFEGTKPGTERGGTPRSEPWEADEGMGIPRADAREYIDVPDSLLDSKSVTGGLPVETGSGKTSQGVFSLLAVGRDRGVSRPFMNEGWASQSEPSSLPASEITDCLRAMGKRDCELHNDGGD